MLGCMPSQQLSCVDRYWAVQVYRNVRNCSRSLQTRNEQQQELSSANRKRWDDNYATALTCATNHLAHLGLRIHRGMAAVAIRRLHYDVVSGRWRIRREHQRVGRTTKVAGKEHRSAV